MIEIFLDLWSIGKASVLWLNETNYIICFTLSIYDIYMMPEYMHHAQHRKRWTEFGFL